MRSAKDTGGVEISLRPDGWRLGGVPGVLAGYGLAVALALLATGVNVLLRPVMEQSATLLYTVVVVVGAWRGGLGPGLLASGLSTLALAYFFVEPVESLQVSGLESLLRLAVFVFVAMLMGGAAAARRQTQREEVQLRARLERHVRERTAELERATTQLRDLAAGLEAAREQERLRLAREVHDVLGSALTVLKMDLARLRHKLADQPPLAAAGEALDTELDEVVQTVRRIASDLRPSLLDDLGLAAAVDWYLSDFGRRSGLKTRFSVSEPAPALVPDDALAVFRVCQEALTNVARHAQASQVEVELAAQPGSLRLVVRDNGQGFDVQQAAQRPTLGLLGMRERLRMRGGWLVVHSRPGHGTRVHIHLPLTSALAG